MEKITFWLEHWEELAAIAGMGWVFLQAAIAFVVKMTPTPDDDAWWTKTKRALGATQSVPPPPKSPEVTP